MNVREELSSSRLSEEELLKLRARDLKSILYTLGFARDEVSRHIDKKELVGMILSSLHAQQATQAADLSRQFIFKTSLFAILVIMVVFFHKHLLAALTFAMRYLWGEHWMFAEKFRLIRKCFRSRLPLACLCLLLSCLIDAVIPLINLSTLLSWFISSDSALRSFLFPSPYIPLSPSTVLGRGSSTGINIGPMLTLWVLKSMKSKLENVAAEGLLKRGGRR